MENGWNRVFRAWSGSPTSHIRHKGTGKHIAAGESRSREGIGPESLTPGELSGLPSRTAPRRVQSYALGRLAARRALAELGLVGSEILRADDGRPLWPDGFVGSIAHTEERGIALVGLANHVAAVGVDVEKRRPVDEIGDLVAFGTELEHITNQDGTTNEKRLLELFAMKEAVFKAFYPAIMEFFGFEAVRIEPVSSELATCRFVQQFQVEVELPTEFPVHWAWDGDEVYAWVVLARNGD